MASKNSDEEKTNIQFQFKEISEHMGKDDFQRNFFESLKTQFESKGWLSEKQIAALDRIYVRVTGDAPKKDFSWEP